MVRQLKAGRKASWAGNGGAARGALPPPQECPSKDDGEERLGIVTGAGWWVPMGKFLFRGTVRC